MTLMDDKFIDSSSLAFYKQNLYEYEQGITVAVVKGRLRTHLLFWVELNNDPSCPDNKKNGRYLLSVLHDYEFIGQVS